MYRDILYIEVHGKSYVYRKAKMPYNMEWRVYFVLLFKTNKELCIARTEDRHWRDVITIEVVRTRARVAFTRHIVVPQQGLVTRCGMGRPPPPRECSSVRCHRPSPEQPSVLGVKGHI